MRSLVRIMGNAIGFLEPGTGARNEGAARSASDVQGSRGQGQAPLRDGDKHGSGDVIVVHSLLSLSGPEASFSIEHAERRSVLGSRSW